MTELLSDEIYSPGDRRGAELRDHEVTRPVQFSKKLGHFWTLPWLEKTARLGEFYWLLKSQYYYRFFWGGMGKGSKLIAPMRLRNVQNIHIGENVLINRYAFFLTLQQDSSVKPRMTIQDGCVIGHMNHFTCTREVHIGKNVLTADRVHISDHSHGFAETTVPILRQPIISKARVSIGEGTWIGENAAVLCCDIGRNCVIGANAVVVNDVPDYSVAVGVPARVVRRFNPVSGLWEKGDGGIE
jgi:acetyltransferase-like isoleucine patch superfamily enzyme